MICSAITTDCGYGNSNVFHIGDVYCPSTKCSGKLCLRKKTFQFFGRSDYQFPQCVSVCQVRNTPFEQQTNPFFLSFGQGVYIFEESPKSIQGNIGDVYCPGKFCLNREKCKSLDGYVTTPRSIYVYGKCIGCLFVHKVLLCYKRTKRRRKQKTRFSFAKKDELGTQQTIVT